MEKKGFVVPNEQQRRGALGDFTNASARMRKCLEVVATFFEPIPKPGPSDWLTEHKEPGQTYDQFKQQHHATITAGENTIVIVPLDVDIP
jgi:hypothetical protein